MSTQMDLITNPTETFDNTELMATTMTQPKTNELLGDNDIETSTNSPTAMTASTAMQNRLFIATDANGHDEHQQLLSNGTKNSSFDITSTTYSVTTKLNSSIIMNGSSSSNMTSNSDSRKNSSNTSFSSSVKYTTMKPCKTSHTNHLQS
jgi:hypothetical protein